jgi:hypothetical protein
VVEAIHAPRRVPQRQPDRQGRRRRGLAEPVDLERQGARRGGGQGRHLSRDRPEVRADRVGEEPDTWERLRRRYRLRGVRRPQARHVLERRRSQVQRSHQCLQGLRPRPCERQDPVDLGRFQRQGLCSRLRRCRCRVRRDRHGDARRARHGQRQEAMDLRRTGKDRLRALDRRSPRPVGYGFMLFGGGGDGGVISFSLGQ